MKHLIIKCYRELFVSILLITVYSILVVLAGLSLSSLLNSVASGDFKEFISVLLVVITLWLGMVVIGYLRSLANHKTIYSLNVEAKKIIINSIVHKDYQFYKDEKSGTYVSWLTNDSKMIEENVFETLLDLYESSITVILTFVSLFSLHPIIAMSSVTFLVIMILVPSLLQNAITEKTNILSAKQEEYSNAVLDLLNGFCEFLNMNKQILLQTKLNKSSYKIEKEKKKFNNFISLTNLLLMFSNVLAQFGLIAISSVLAIMEFAQFGSILAVGNLAGTFYNSSANCVQLLMQYKGNLSLLNKYDYDCKAPNSIEDINIDTLDIKDLTFGYNENVDVLRDFNLHVKKGIK